MCVPQRPTIWSPTLLLQINQQLVLTGGSHCAPVQTTTLRNQNVAARKPKNECVLPSEAQAEMKFVTHALMNSLSPNSATQQLICPAWIPLKNALSSSTRSRKTRLQKEFIVEDVFPPRNPKNLWLEAAFCLWNPV